MEKILDGKRCAQFYYERLERAVQDLKEKGKTPKLVVIIVGEDAASHIYVKNKEKAAQRIGIDSETVYLPKETTEEELLRYIHHYNSLMEVDGILVQTPLPNHICADKVLEAIDPRKDVDGFHPHNVGALYCGTPQSYPCTPLGIIQLLKYYDYSFEGKNVVVVGRSNIVGRPMAQLLLKEDATVTICHSKTKDIASYLQNADLIVVAIGVANWLQPEWIKKEAVLVDVGMNRTKEGLRGDISKAAQEKACAYTPVPGGVGPMTIAMLMAQTVYFAQQKEG